MCKRLNKLLPIALNTFICEPIMLVTQGSMISVVCVCVCVCVWFLPIHSGHQVRSLIPCYTIRESISSRVAISELVNIEH